MNGERGLVRLGERFRGLLESERRTLALGVMIVLLGAVPAFASRLQPDTAWLLYAGERMLDGARPYVDFIETNPPLILWLDLVPVAAARLLGVPSGPVFTAVALILALSSAVWSAQLLRRMLPKAVVFRRYLILLILVALVPLARQDFGEREHLFLSLALPYVLLAALRLRGGQVSRRHAFAAGAAAGVGIALKPYFILLWLSLEGLHASAGWKTWRPRPETVAIVVTGAAYLLAVALWTPEYFEVVRTMGKAYYTFLRNPILTTALLGDGAQLPLIALLCYLALRGDAGRRVLWTTLACAMAALWLGGVLQQKGWRYHFYPSLALGVILCGVIAVDRRTVAVQRIRRLYASVAAATALGAILLTAGACVRQAVDPLNPRYDADPDVSRLVPVVGRYAGRPVLVLSWSTASAFPLMTYARVKNVSRFNHLWILGAIYWPALRQPGPLAYHARGEMAPLERSFNDALVEDMTRHPPALIVALRPGPDRPEWGLRRLDFVGYFRRDPRFARLFDDFTYDRQVGEYWLFRRTGPGEHAVPPPSRPVLAEGTPDRGLSGSFGAPALPDIGLWLFSVVLLAICYALQPSWDRRWGAGGP